MFGFATVRSTIIVLATCAALGSASAQDFPSRGLKFVVPYPPGGTTDSVARVVAQKLQEVIGQPVVIENKGGGGGMIAGDIVARSEPDGYTLFFAANGPLLFAPAMSSKAPYKWDRDFVAVSMVAVTPAMLEVHPSVPAKTFAEFVAYAKREGSKINYASSGVGTINHLAGELLKMMIGADYTIIQYKGNAPMMTDLLGGQVQFGIDQTIIALPQVKEGKLRALAVTTKTRLLELPDVPTMAEVGYGGLTANTFAAVMTPAKTPPAVVATLNAALEKVLKSPDVIEKLGKMGADAAYTTPEQAMRDLKADDATWTKVIRDANVRME